MESVIHKEDEVLEAVGVHIREEMCFNRPAGLGEALGEGYRARAAQVEPDRAPGLGGRAGR